MSRYIIYRMINKLFNIEIDRCDKCGSRLNNKEIKKGENLCEECINQ